MPAFTLKQVQEDPNRDDIFGLLNKYIQPADTDNKPTLSASQAASAFSQSVKGKAKDEAFFWKFWADIFAVARQIPHGDPGLDKLALFVREISLLPDEEDVEPVWESRVWTDLPLLGASIRENLDTPASASTDDGSKEGGREYLNTTKAWVSFHAFVARLLHAGVSPGSETTAIWMLRDALEREDQDQDPDDDAFERKLMQAAAYIEYAGATLVSLIHQSGSEEPGLDETKKRLTKGGPLWKGGSGSGLTAARWRFWGKRFSEQAARIKDQDDGNTEARDMPLHAARLIEVWSRTRLS
ncbi:hypothetical protein F5Y17DRAFT_432012 [Xylariaceae sp. FL0594]|nr:hypothetical protein F5Y17DRAFT_432012 [Xylariaceae sp. FL0594]